MASLLRRVVDRCRFTRRPPWRPWLSATGRAAVERLEPRVMLTPGSILWAPPADLRPTDDDSFADVAVQADGKVVAVGTALVSGDDDFLIARYTAAGKLDTGFVGGGWRAVDFGNGRNDFATSVVIQGDGKIVIGGGSAPGNDNFGTTFALLRLNRDGSVDTSFGTLGKVLGPAAGLAHISSLALTSTGRIVAGARVSQSGLVARYLADGNPDSSFGGGDGLVSVGSAINGVAVDGSDRIVTVHGDGVVARLTFEGTYDESFDDDGFKSVLFDVGSSASLAGVAIDAAGRIVVAGSSNEGTFYQSGVARLLPNGAYDQTFSFNGRTSFNFTANVSDFLNDVAVLPNGAVVVAGRDDALSPDWTLALLTPDGLLDNGFDGDGKLTITRGGSDSVGGVAVTKTGHYVVAGTVDVTDQDTAPSIVLFEGRYPRRDDLAGWTNAGQWWVASSTGTAFENRYFGSWDPGLGWKIVAAADVNGDGRADVVGRDRSGRWWVGVNTGTGFATTLWGNWTEAAGWRDERFADFTGDGKADVAGRTSGGQWWVMRSTGTGFAAAMVFAAWTESAGWRDVTAADFTGDGRTDLAGRTAGGQWWVSRYIVGGNRFQTDLWAGWTESAGWRDVRTGDFDGDGRADLAGRTSGGQWWVARSIGTSFSSTAWAPWTESAGWRDVVVGDFDGDGRSDLAGRTAAGQWWVARSGGAGFTNTAWDTWSASAGWRDVRVGDFDGDGRADIAGRTSTGQWWVAKSDGSRFVAARWGSWTESVGWRTFWEEFTPTLT